VYLLITDNVKLNYIKFQNTNKKIKIIELLTNALKSKDFNDEERCWALWNISDNLAILKKPNDELINHKLFEKQLLQMDSKYLHWIVSDGTQKMTLFIGGYERYWFNLYKFACDQSPKTTENRRIRFESHRAAIAIPVKTQYTFNQEHSIFALDNMKNILCELNDDCNYIFYELTYFTQYIGFDTLFGRISTNILEKSMHSFFNIINLLSYNDKTNNANDYLLGSWQQLNNACSKYTQAKICAGNYIISLVNAGQYQSALYCYHAIESFNLPISDYFNRKIQFARLHCNSSKT
jgi:hypothetical protein